MASMADDCDAELRMLIQAYKRLKDQSPSHELLAHGMPDADEYGMTFNDSFYRDFKRADDLHNIQSWSRYRIKMEAALSR